eukprot:CAMPEP_0178441980 /NCGR_PEP_ID=MMETSP0689_2-20121128/37866_1 /TAXON_ID=160604 /ORGANISM="Amphidinium massartii, Strain CS-259" /LENGTH=184 /DNA_ID=CAMNT_0020065387 /DNA_START=8 /DNA_END=563 /DNA_ORIENTATION=-
MTLKLKLQQSSGSKEDGVFVPFTPALLKFSVPRRKYGTTSILGGDQGPHAPVGQAKHALDALHGNVGEIALFLRKSTSNPASTAFTGYGRPLLGEDKALEVPRHHIAHEVDKRKAMAACVNGRRQVDKLYCPANPAESSICTNSHRVRSLRKELQHKEAAASVPPTPTPCTAPEPSGDKKNGCM